MADDALPQKPPVVDTLYERDFHAWTQEQARLVRSRDAEALDWENIAEEIESLGRSDRRELASRIELLLRHLLKWEFQTALRSRSWENTIREQRAQIERLLDASPSLRNEARSQFAKEYSRARKRAGDESRQPMSTFPELPPYPLEQALDDAFFPGVPFDPDQIDQT